jgi:hypothetical protein
MSSGKSNPIESSVEVDRRTALSRARTELADPRPDRVGMIG